MTRLDHKAGSSGGCSRGRSSLREKVPFAQVQAKLREPERLPRLKNAPGTILELEPDGGFDLAHLRAAFERRDLAVVSARAVDATVGTVVLTEGVNGVIEDVIRIHKELRAELLGDGEGFRDRQVGIKPSRTVVSVAPNVADEAAVGKCKGPCSRTRQGASVSTHRQGGGIRIRQCGHWREECASVIDRVQRSDTCVKLRTCGVWPTWTCVGHIAALTNARRPGQAAAPIGGVADLPSTDDVILRLAGISHVLLAPAEWQFIDGIEDPDVVAVEIDSSPGIDVADRVVVVLRIAVRLGVGIVGQELQALRETLIEFDFEGVVVAACIVAVVVPQIERNPGVQRTAAVLRSEGTESSVGCLALSWLGSGRWVNRGCTFSLCRFSVRPEYEGLSNIVAVSRPGRVDVIVWTIAGKTVRALAADV